MNSEAMIILYLVIIGISIIINSIGASLMRKSAILKGYGDESHVFAICFWLGIFGYLYVISLPDLIAQNQNQQIIEMMKGGNR
jgi:hypothetical protein